MPLFPRSIQRGFCRGTEVCSGAAGIHQGHFDLYPFSCFSELQTATPRVLSKKLQIHEQDIAQIFSKPSLAFH